ncbi:MAG: hypothetical protein GXP25_25195 [Planctomycetes bacterium]|nr:hypothetical protein [Planctomycetota bacterium]
MKRVELLEQKSYRVFSLLFVVALILGLGAPTAIGKGKGRGKKAGKSDQGEGSDSHGDKKDSERGGSKRVGRGGLGGALGGMVKEGMKGGETIDVYGGPPYGDVGRFVRQKLDEGLKGHELAKAIHAYLQERKADKDAGKAEKKAGKGKKAADQAAEEDEAIGADVAEVMSQGGNTQELGKKIEERTRNRARRRRGKGQGTEEGSGQGGKGKRKGRGKGRGRCK